ncbi:MAG: hypothetical protein A2297_04260 [Elusimicrobia bacterium RIFOXYB2_FULL_48_7]|nr:MAG: hypothetical protein A2297_04260 [Elusimicrobia bacterium RIFOXYB2_FULL_48_7]
MKVSLEELKNRQLIESSYEDSSLAENLNFKLKKPINIRFSLALSSDLISFNLAAEGTAVFECDRCLEDFDYKLGIDESSTIPLSDFGESIDITEELRQNVSLDLPVKKICRENCLGLCPVCGKNKNSENCGCKNTAPSEEGRINSKFEKLKNIKF